jgi:hypothetical protein
VKSNEFEQVKSMILSLKIGKLGLIRILFGCVSATYFYLNTIASLDLTSGGHVLFMDERITFDGVSNILHPSSLQDWLASVVDGDDQRYGRIIWNLAAIFSWGPEMVYGETGQIFATRTLQALLIFFAALLFSRIYPKSPLTNLFIFSIILFFPFSSYYSTMPKPEPLMIFLISLFLFLYKRRKSNSKTMFVILGILVGVKISGIVFALFGLILLTNNVKNRIEFIKSNLHLMLIGFVISVPLFVIYLPLYFCTRKIYYKHFRCKGLIYSLLYTLIQLSQILLVDVIASKILGKKIFIGWLQWTVFGTKHGSDSDEINALSWFKYFYTNWSDSIIIPSLILLFGLTALVLNINHISRSQSREFFIRFEIYIFTCGSGLTSLAIVFFGIDRLWGMYLYIPLLLILVGSIWALTEGLEKRSKTSGADQLLRSVFILLLIGLLFKAGTEATGKYLVLSTRTQTNSYEIASKDYMFMQTYLNQSKSLGSKVEVLIDPLMFVPTSREGFTFKNFWGPVLDFEDADIVILDKVHLPENSVNQSEIDFFKANVLDTPSFCNFEFCYVEDGNLPSGGIILKRVRGSGVIAP